VHIVSALRRRPAVTRGRLSVSSAPIRSGYSGLGNYPSTDARPLVGTPVLESSDPIGARTLPQVSARFDWS
jgi:hypothetical protein